VHGAFGRRQLGADQILVNLDQLRLVSIEVAPDMAADRFPAALLRGPQPSLPGEGT
jgi:hypothetical protein